MFGSAGGLMEIRASLLASHGFAVLALPFFKYEDLPAGLEEVTFDYFEVRDFMLKVLGKLSRGPLLLEMFSHLDNVQFR